MRDANSGERTFQCRFGTCPVYIVGTTAQSLLCSPRGFLGAGDVYLLCALGSVCEYTNDIAAHLHEAATDRESDNVAVNISNGRLSYCQLGHERSMIRQYSQRPFCSRDHYGDRILFQDDALRSHYL